MHRIATTVLFAAVFSASTLLLPHPALAADTFKLDSAHSFVIFEIQHLKMGTTWGRVNSPSGTVTIDSANPANSSLAVEVKVENVDTGIKQRDDHLKGPDFFDGKQFPNISFKSTSFKAAGNDSYEVAGDMTLHGVTKPLTVTLKKTAEGDTRMGPRAAFETTFKIKRSDFGMNSMPDAVGDEVTLHVAIEAGK